MLLIIDKDWFFCPGDASVTKLFTANEVGDCTFLTLDHLWF